jgi:hypothetical protein
MWQIGGAVSENEARTVSHYRVLPAYRELRSKAVGPERDVIGATQMQLWGGRELMNESVYGQKSALCKQSGNEQAFVPGSCQGHSDVAGCILVSRS